MPSNDDDFETLSPDNAKAGAPKKAGPSLKARAIGYLSRREHSRRELSRKLAPFTDDPHEIESLLNQLERENWLSNERFAQSLLNRRASRQGASRILSELRQHGVDDTAIASMGQQLQDTEFERARAVWERKFGQPPKNAKDYARQYRFLASRGFAAECLRRILGDIPYGSD
ncbi:recombination regulator RecX [Pollutimonas harenae]|uniref:Regulatory protein RecX n=1 Tax=Pollutimonas harenae TaxID=657015 RepID=A0A853GU80_9BURK|nr:recombination regulator RecX [Pollutimonas harenae]NYT85821.1 recombination regulator RecX [Pollutimonas harenae]TEA70879.1 recombination regulator RecX [Pollutimonas harenae]